MSGSWPNTTAGGGAREHEWHFQAVTACQALVVDLNIDPDGRRFAAAFRLFAARLPPPSSATDGLFLRDRITSCAIRAGTDFHNGFHSRFDTRRCAAAPVEASAQILTRFGDDPRRLVRVWVSAYLKTFSEHHAWPATDKAASIIERRSRQQLSLARLAREVGCGKSTLVRHFEKDFGIPIHEYQTRVRLRHAIPALRDRHTKVEVVSRAAGYRAVKNFYRALWTRTGLRPSDCRNLTDADVEDLLISRLRLPRRLPRP